MLSDRKQLDVTGEGRVVGSQLLDSHWVVQQAIFEDAYGQFSISQTLIVHGLSPLLVSGCFKVLAENALES